MPVLVCSGEKWNQFSPLSAQATHPTFHNRWSPESVIITVDNLYVYVGALNPLILIYS